MSSIIHLLLVSVEDASKCKRPISVPGIEVKVKRVVVRFAYDVTRDQLS